MQTKTAKRLQAASLLLLISVLPFLMSCDKLQQLPFANVTGKLAYIRTKEMKKFEVVIVDLATSQKNIIELDVFRVAGLDFSPDGKYLAAQTEFKWSKNKHISIIDIKNKTITNVLENEQRLMFPKFSPNFSKLVFYKLDTKNNNQNTVYISKINGKDIMQLTRGADNCTYPGWHPNPATNKIIFISKDHRIVEQDIVSTEQSTIYELDASEDINNLHFPTYSRDGKQLLFVECLGGGIQRPSEIKLMTLSTGEIKTIYNTEHLIGSLSFINDSVICFSEVYLPDSDIILYNYKLKKKKQIKDPGYFKIYPTWTP
ncbi:MAG: hypothetical protein ABIH39_06935 [Candidatus Margulisiibacteriota bacterium]